MVDRIQVGQELLNVPMGEMVKSLALSIAQAQWELDKSSMTVAEMMSGQRLMRDLDTGMLLDAQGVPLDDQSPDAAGVVIDSRVYFGYDYEQTDEGVKRKPAKLSMMELGFTPVFYQFVDTIIEVKISVKMVGSTENATQEKATQSSYDNSYEYRGTNSWWRYGGYSGQARHKVEARVSTVDANFSSKYSYSIEGSSVLRTKLVPIPPPSILEDRIRQVMEDGDKWRELLTKGIVNGADGTFVDPADVKKVQEAQKILAT